MKKLQIVLSALFAMLVFGVSVVAAALAETTLPAEWLANSAKITLPLASEAIGNMLFEDNKANGGMSILCSFILVGTVGPSGSDQVTEMISLAHTKVDLNNKMVCENEKGCGGPPEMAPEGLPWKTTLFLMENGEILDLYEGLSNTFFCTILGIRVEDTCTAVDMELPVLNDAVTGDADTPGGSLATPNATCSIGGANGGVIETDELWEHGLKSGELLIVSSE